nr:sugar nucleotide-binding protein [Micropepsaceae bacterium]
PTADVTPISTAEYPTAARRPANSRLDCTKLSQTFGITLPDWREALEPVMDVLVRPLRPLR